MLGLSVKYLLIGGGHIVLQFIILSIFLFFDNIFSLSGYLCKHQLGTSFYANAICFYHTQIRFQLRLINLLLLLGIFTCYSTKVSHGQGQTSKNIFHNF